MARLISPVDFSGASRVRLSSSGSSMFTRQPVGIEAGLGGQFGARAGDQLQVDVAAKVVGLTQGPGD